MEAESCQRVVLKSVPAFFNLGGFRDPCLLATEMKFTTQTMLNSLHLAISVLDDDLLRYKW